MMKKLIFLFFVIIEIVSWSNIGIPKRSLEEATKSEDIVILHTNDVHCGVQDTIGYDGLMLYKKQLLTKYNNVIVVDAGDHIQGGTMGVISNGLSIIDIMNEVGYDVATLGNHEFDYGIAQLEECEKRLNCSYISSNYCFHKNKTAIYPAYKIIEKGGKKIAFIGVATPQTLSKTYLITLTDDEGNLIYDFLTENNSKELYERVQEHINKVKNDEKVDYVIIVAHLGIGGDALEENTSEGLLKNLEGVDALIDGHTHLVYSQTTKDKNGKDVILAQTGTKLANIGVLIIHENGTLTHENINEVPFDPNLADETLNVTRNKKEAYVDKEINKYINDIFLSFSDTLNKVVGKVDFPLNVYENASVSTESHTQLSRVSENVLCNLVCDALRELGGADVTIMNAGSVRTDINQGDITYQDIINTMPFSNDVLVKEITGQAILDALEYGVRILPEPTSRFPQVSGITYKIDTSINSPVIVDENEVFEKVEGERRVYDVKINGEDIDVNKKYTISTNSFIIGGGDGYSMFIPFDVVKTSIGVDNEILLKYIEENLNGVIPSKYKKVEGRIVKTNGKIFKQNTISLLGFNRLNITDSIIRFYIYLISLESFIFPNALSLKVTLTSNSFLRALSEQNKEVECKINSSDSDTKASYVCEILTTTSDIDSIQIHRDIELNTDKDYEFYISPLALKYMDNIKNIRNDDKYNAFFDSDIYYLKNSHIIKHDETSYNISGVLTNFGNSSDFDGSDITLMVTKLPENTETEFNCKIYHVTGDNYTLNCKPKDSIYCDLNNSISLIGDGVLYVSFENGDDSKIKFDSKNPIESYNRKYFHKSSGKLSSGAIATIIVVPIIALAAIIALIYFLKSGNKKLLHPQAPSSESITKLN